MKHDKERNGVARVPPRTTLIPKHVDWPTSVANPASAPVPSPAQPDVLAPAERLDLMDATAERLHQQYRGGNIDWPVGDAINAKIGTTFTRRELVTLLAEYAAAILRGGEN